LAIAACVTLILIPLRPQDDHGSRLDLLFGHKLGEGKPTSPGLLEKMKDLFTCFARDLK
jgi:hypothetical protein